MLGACGLVLILILVIVGAVNESKFWVPMILVAIYLLICLTVITILKYKSSYQMRMSQFLLSVFCRAENNRLYLKNGVEVRPGFTGKWIEFTCLDMNKYTIDDVVQQMRQRFLKPCLEQKAALFDREIMS